MPLLLLISTHEMHSKGTASFTEGKRHLDVWPSSGSIKKGLKANIMHTASLHSTLALSRLLTATSWDFNTVSKSGKRDTETFHFDTMHHATMQIMQAVQAAKVAQSS